MEEGKSCACGECDCQPDLLVLVSELDHYSKLVRDLKRKEVSRQKKTPRRMSQGTLLEYNEHLKIIQVACHLAKTIAD